MSGLRLAVKNRVADGLLPFAGLRSCMSIAPCPQAAMHAQPAHALLCARGDRRCFLSFPTGLESVGAKSGES